MLILPLKIDLVINQVPKANLIIIAVCIIVFLLLSYSPMDDWIASYFILQKWKISSFIGYQFLHADYIHLIGNMIFLWVFGNAICSIIGNLNYVFLFVFCGLFAAIVHLIIDGSYAVGASASIYGIIGFFVVLYPKNQMKCFLWFFYLIKTIKISPYIIIGFWVFEDIVGLLKPDTNVGHLAHLAGFLFGFVSAYWLVIKGFIKKRTYDLETLPDLLSK